MKHQMCWLPCANNRTKIVLHLREYAHQPWKPYTASPFSVPDYKVPKGSKGWATYQKLRQNGWTLIASDRARERSIMFDSSKTSPQKAMTYSRQS